MRRYEQTADYERLVSRIKELYETGKSYAEIAEHLNSEGFRPAKQVRAVSKVNRRSDLQSSATGSTDCPKDVEHNSACSK